MFNIDTSKILSVVKHRLIVFIAHLETISDLKNIEEKMFPTQCLRGGTRVNLCDKDCSFCFAKSFASSEKAKYWNKKNVGLNKKGELIVPRNISKGSNNKFIFDCDVCNHEFESSIDKIQYGRWCPYCGHRKICQNDCSFCFEKSFASSDKAKYWSKKNVVSPRSIFKNAIKKFIFDCDVCNHEFEMRLASVSQGNWCIFCSNNNLCQRNDCSCFEKSFASSDKAKYWSKKNVVSPRSIFQNTHTKFKFDCDVCNHEFEMRLASVSSGSWCSYCSHRKLCQNDCSYCFAKSFASSEKAKYWSKKNIDEKGEFISPRSVFKNANNKFKFDCNVCNHEFEANLNSVSGKSPSWCSYCGGNQGSLCQRNDCSFCFEKSFASSNKAKFWNKKNIDEKGVFISPRNVCKSANRKFIFNCDVCNHEFEASLGNISNGTWCPMCHNKTEKKLYDWLKEKIPVTLTQVKFDWCKNEVTNRHLPFDFVIPSMMLIIECDGRQHFEQVSNWSSPENQKERDFFKMKQAFLNGYTIIRVFQEDIFNDTGNWEELLSKELYQREIPETVLIGSDKSFHIHFTEKNEE